ncbi:MAG: type II toxin-antitoxin system RelB/DinJ family antitoxin [Erysipelotrichaceae bacterium]|nr:type II toxin-antitoxin system RelB/DinJ family antitoxin [Erysipelotrichaceae bacterium]MBR2551711.1 type II toxin-antitoxin system RelB/DinJ family antitoxin [Erysipelotrichaceae bacterium]
MPVKTANFNMRMEEQKKADAEALYRTLGMTLPQAINMFISQSLLVGGIPFDVRIPRFNQETEAAMKEAEGIAAGRIEAKTYHSARELFAELDAE